MKGVKINKDLIMNEKFEFGEWVIVDSMLVRHICHKNVYYDEFNKVDIQKQERFKEWKKYKGEKK